MSSRKLATSCPILPGTVQVATHPPRTAFHHLFAFAQTMGLGRKRVEEVLGLVGLSDVADRPIREFSLGMNQRLGIATALLGDPGVLVLDEPLNGARPGGHPLSSSTR